MLKKILLVEDDSSLGESLKSVLVKSHSVEWVQSVKEAAQQLRAHSFDLAILDLNLPDGSGFDVAHLVATQSQGTRFIFLTAHSDAESRLRGFDLGAEDFIPKPFHLRELLMRVDHIFKEHRPKVVTIEYSGGTIDLDRMCVSRNGDSKQLTHNETQVLKLLIEQAPQAMSRDEIINRVWGVDHDMSHRSIDNLIVKIRSALGDSGSQTIRSVRGIGYQWSDSHSE